MGKVQRIVLAADLSEMSTPLYILGERLARRSGAQLIIAHIADRDDYVELLKEAGVALDEHLGRLRSAILYEFERATGVRVPRTYVDVQLRKRSVAKDLLDVAERQDAALIIIGTHGRSGISRALLGSVAEEVLRHATCPVLVVPKRAAGQETEAAEAVPMVSGVS